MSIGKGGLHYGWIILILGIIVVTGALGFARFGYTTILPDMKSGLGLTNVEAGDIASGNMIGYLVLALTCGILASRFGPRVMIGVSLLVVAASMALTGLAGSFVMALVARTITGMGSGGANVPVMGLVSSWFHPKKRGLAAGIVVSGSSFGLLVTGSILPGILDSGVDGWRYAWYVLAALTLCIAFIGFIFLRNSPAEKGITPVGAQIVPEEKRRKTSRLEWGRIYKNPSVWHLGIIYILFGFSYIIYATFFVHYLTGEAGYTKEAANWLLALILGGLSIGSGLIWGIVSDKVGRKYGLAIVFFLQFLCFTIFGIWNEPVGHIISAILFALTAWSIPAIMAATTGDVVGSQLAPAALGFITLLFGIGQFLGPAMAGRIADATGSYSKAFVIAGAAALLGSVLSLFIKRHTARED
ncbi:MAG: YbfB/YjiJ family MFS transporter [Spirochaetales bacterium]|nr:YbfB/YjiJ family MFS transporter [Spirochaetales bacterium]